MNAVGIDIGTTSVCGVSINIEAGKIEKSCTKNSNAFLNDCESWAKMQSVEKIMSAAMEILNDFVDDETVVIGVTGQMHGIVYADINGNAVSPLYTWQDERGNLPYKNTTYAKYLNSFSGYGNVTDFYNRENGIRPAEAVTYCTIHDYFVMQLCGLKSPLMHSTNAASLGCYDLESNQFHYDCNIDVVADYCIAGEYKGIPVSVAIGDNQASVFSTLADENNILLNVGTGSQVSIITDTIICTDDIETRPYFDNKYLACGAALCGGRAYSLLKSFYSEILSYSKELDENEVYAIMNKMLEKGEDRLKVDVRFAGTRKHPELSGNITGITTDNFTPSNLTYGVLDGMAEELFQMYTQMHSNRSGIVGSGNGIRKNNALIKVFEKKFGASMKLPGHLEEAAFGAALFGLVSCGEFECAADVQKLIQYV